MTDFEKYKEGKLKNPEFRKKYEAQQPKYDKIADTIRANLSEADLKRAVKDFLQYKMNLGELYFDQLFSGEAIEVRGKTRRKVQGCRAGTADFVVIRKWYPVGAPNKAETLVTFFELKSTKGKTTKEQDEFAKLVRDIGCSYFVVRNLEKLKEILRGNT